MKATICALSLLTAINLSAAAQSGGFSLRPGVAAGITKTWGDVAWGMFPAYGGQIMAGLDVGYHVAKRLEIGTGLAFSSYNIRYCKSGPTDKQGDYDTIGRQQLSFLQVPLSIRWFTAGDRRHRMVGLLEIGVLYNILMHARTSAAMRYTDKPVQGELSNKDQLNAGGFSLLVSPGWSVPVNEKVAVDLSISGIIGLSPLGGEHVKLPASGYPEQRRFPNVAYPTTIALVRFGLRMEL